MRSGHYNIYKRKKNELKREIANMNAGKGEERKQSGLDKYMIRGNDNTVFCLIIFEKQKKQEKLIFREKIKFNNFYLTPLFYLNIFYFNCNIVTIDFLFIYS